MKSILQFIRPPSNTMYNLAIDNVIKQLQDYVWAWIISMIRNWLIQSFFWGREVRENHYFSGQVRENSRSQGILLVHVMKKKKKIFFGVLYKNLICIYSSLLVFGKPLYSHCKKSQGILFAKVKESKDIYRSFSSRNPAIVFMAFLIQYAFLD